MIRNCDRCAAAAAFDATWSVEALLKANADPNALCLKRAALGSAAQHGSLASARILINHGADPNLGGQPPLCLATAYGNDSVAQFLIRSGATINLARNIFEPNFPPTTLFAAAHLGRAGAMKVLLDASADVDQGRQRGGEDLSCSLS